MCHSSIITRIDSYDNHYTSADISGTTSLVQFSLSGSKLASLDIGTANNLTNVQLKDCDLTESQIDYVLQKLDGAGLSNGNLELNGNAAPSAAGLVYHSNLKQRGWTIAINSVTDIFDIGGKEETTKIIMNSFELKMLLKDDFISWKADLYNFNGYLIVSKLVESDILVFDISSLSPGIYMVVLSKGEKKRVAKVIKP